MATEQLAFEIGRTSNSRLNKVNFKELVFGREFSDHMLIAEFADGKWHRGRIIPFDQLTFSPASSVFHYGQAIFEGLKAHQLSNGKIILFRPQMNFNRFNNSALRMCMPEVPESLFMDGIKKLVQVDREWVPKGDNGESLYIRPFMVGDDAFLGVKPSTTYKFMIITSPTANYYRGAVSVKVENHYTRACQGGIGYAKAAANYAASLLPARKAQMAGYDQLIWTDAKEHKYIEESGTMNIMFIIGDKLITPTLQSQTILPGITRDSILTLAREWKMTVEERRVSVEEIKEAIKQGNLKEAFGVGTAATVAPIKRIGFPEGDFHLTDHQSWEFANKVKNYLERLKRGEEKDIFNWTVPIL
jgi:branched-chain amino acid aminotransferase